MINFILCFLCAILAVVLMMVAITEATEVWYEHRTRDLINETRRLAVINRLRSMAAEHAESE